MKKEKMVTRTIVKTDVTVKQFNSENGSVYDTVFELMGDYDVKQATITIRDLYHADDIVKFIMVESVERIEKLYGMPESVFVANAVEMPPRKVNETQEDV